jgi:hypothetical protein
VLRDTKARWSFNLPVKGNRVVRSKLITEVPGSYPMLVGTEENIKRKISVPLNTLGYVVPYTSKANRIINLMSRLFIPDRIRWDTSNRKGRFLQMYISW